MSGIAKSCTLTFAIAAVFASAAAQRRAMPSRDELARNNKMFIAGASKALKWEEPAEPLRIAGPLYFVGTQGLGVYLITTREGHILINTGMPSSGPMIAESIRRLGFRPEDIEILLTSHAHADHAGAMAYLKALSGARIAMMEGDVAAMEDGGRSDFHYGWDWRVMGFPPARVDRVLRDGDTVRLGEVVLTALNTPCHTRGDTTWTTTIVADGRPYSVAWPDGMSINPGYRLLRNPSYPGIADDCRRTAHRLEMLRPDIWLVSHTERFDLEGKRARAAQVGAQAFVDPEGYRRYVAAQRATFEALLTAEMDAPSDEDGIRRGMATQGGQGE